MSGSGMSGHRLACLLALAATALAGPALADSRVIEGHSLTLTTTLSEDSTVVMDPTLSGTIRYQTDGGVDCISATGGGSAVISTANCDSETTGLRISIPPGAPLTVTVAGSGNLNLGDLAGAPIDATITASGDIKGGRVTALKLVVRGSGDASFSEADGPIDVTSEASGDVRFGKLNGTLTLRQTGSGDVAVGAISAGPVDVEGHSSGDLLIGGGTIGSLHAVRSGSGDLVVAAKVIEADVSASGGGDVKLGQVVGSIRKSASDGSDIIVGGPGMVDALERQVARHAAGEDASDSDAGTGNRTTSHSTSVHWHILTVIVGVVVLVLVWRAIRRAGGYPAVRKRFAGGSGAAMSSPTHPGVIALAEMMQRLDQRLGKVEGYVTSREFDLQQKFRDLK
jgi:hypothetical protein